ncbi:pyridoxal phosphate-dependent transferase [Elsinoe ampelina]|uniref:Molybdenum cofactor sulfurase n=1 Tax=Elsinoe ampelina TaxID=302913 RepID=A0A6A6G914_9PEZI|nr:pyridoxal phosphate-dependent transferase [Elsinoe ampelina]
MVETTGDRSVFEQEEDLRYNAYIEEMRKEQYPMLEDALYLDHAGTTLTSKRLMDLFHQEMISNLYGNPHSFSQASHRTAAVIDTVRLKLLACVKADPTQFDVVFTANATAAIKLVADAFRDYTYGFQYNYHNESHTSLVGVRELAEDSICLGTDNEVEDWLREKRQAAKEQPGRPTLFAYPAQSNLDGRRLPLSWPAKLRQESTEGHQSIRWTLLDASAYVSTTPLDLSDADSSPDFTALSLYKIFGFPDMGALIVRRQSAAILGHRKYFGGGTVDMVVNQQFSDRETNVARHIRKDTSIHERLEDGTLPYHNIIALNCAMSAHTQLFDSLERVSRHTRFLTRHLRDGLNKLKHANGHSLVHMYTQTGMVDDQTRDQGPIVAFNLQNSAGDFISLYEFEKIAFARNINVRTGGHCNPGGTASHLGLTADDTRANYASGHRCGSECDLVDGRPTGTIRASLGAMSTVSDILRFLSFLEEYYIEKHPEIRQSIDSTGQCSKLRVESLTLYPIKSCAGWTIPPDVSWQIRSEGLAWDREWCVVHAITEKALSQKRYPSMALIRPEIDMQNKVLNVRGLHAVSKTPLKITLPLQSPTGLAQDAAGEVCGMKCDLLLHKDSAIDDFFTNCIGVPARLARFPTRVDTQSRRHAKEHPNRGIQGLGRSIAFSNESPILTITRASLNRLNETIKQQGGKAAAPAVFRANIVLGSTESSKPGDETPYAEDDWCGMTIGETQFDFLGGCRRCQMICIDQSTGERNSEPFSTLAKTRKINGRVMFGVHTALAEDIGSQASIKTGDEVTIWDGRDG